MQDALQQYKGSEAETRFTAAAQFEGNIAAFFRERIDFYLREAKGFAYDVANAVLAAGADNPLDCQARAEAVAGVRGSEDFAAISASVKRIKNILRQATEAGKWSAEAASAVAKPSASASDAERALAAKTAALAASTAELCQQKRYSEALGALAAIRRPLDEFFDKVMVMADDAAERSARLALLQEIQAMFGQIADFSEVVAGGRGA